ncbi:MAG: hypothetical protein AAGF23_21135 [Acidobacteriota bacterium]
MNLDRLTPEAIRSNDSINRVTSLDVAEMKKTIGGALNFGCFPCDGDGCGIYIDFTCYGSPDQELR